MAVSNKKAGGGRKRRWRLTRLGLDLDLDLDLDLPFSLSSSSFSRSFVAAALSPAAPVETRLLSFFLSVDLSCFILLLPLSPS